MVQIDDGPADGPPGNELRTAWVELTAGEAYELLESLKVWAEEVEEGHHDPDWHTHIGSSDATELTISIRLAEESSTRRG